METLQNKRASSYGAGPPWIFEGRALYQLHLVRADVARKVIPKELKLVQAFGYTLGGMYLAHYDDSPAGMFDELVVIAGTVWNPPTSCAWAARVLVNSEEACNHGRKEVGLPSQLAFFSWKGKSADDPQKTKQNVFSKLLPEQRLQMDKHAKHKKKLEVEIFDVNGSSREPFCLINLRSDVMEPKSHRRWKGPSMRMSLPSFSGCTELQPQLLKYSCNMSCRIRMVEPAQVLTADTLDSTHVDNKIPGSASDWKQNLNQGDTTKNDAQNLVISLLESRPILALAFEHMKLHVRAPIVVSLKERHMKQVNRDNKFQSDTN